MNSIAEQTNPTIINSARDTLTHARLPLQIWSLDIIDAVNKYNILSHTNTCDTAHKRWNGFKTPLPPLLPFTTIGTVPIRTQKTKMKSRALMSWYMYTLNTTQIIVLGTDDQNAHYVVEIDFRLLHPAETQATVQANALAARQPTL